MMKNIRFSFFVFLTITIIGVYMFSFYLTDVVTYLYNYNHYSEVNGKIVGYSLGENNQKSMVISYEVNNETYKITSTFTDEENYPVGNGIVVKYDEKNPEKYILGNEKLYFGYIVIGLTMFIFGLMGMISSYGKKNKKGDK